MNTLDLEPTKEFLANFCKKYKVRELCLFGSAVRDDFIDSSDIDILVEFEADSRVGIMKFTKIQRELSEAFGRPVDLVSKNGLNPIIREEVISSAKTLCAA
jgi:predicted nucleotidyltransferase